MFVKEKDVFNINENAASIDKITMWEAFESTFLTLKSGYLWFSIAVWLLFFIIVFGIKIRSINFDGFEKIAAFFSMLGIYVFLTVFFMAKAYRFEMGTTWDGIGPIGDVIGGTTVAFFTLASLILLVGTIRHQRREMQETNVNMQLQQVEQTYFEAETSLMNTRDELTKSTVLPNMKSAPNNMKRTVHFAPWMDDHQHEYNAYEVVFSNTTVEKVNELNTIQYFNAALYQRTVLSSTMVKPCPYIGKYGFHSWFDVLLIVHFKEQLLEATFGELDAYVSTFDDYDYDEENMRLHKLDIITPNEEGYPQDTGFDFFKDYFSDLSWDIIFELFIILSKIHNVEQQEDAEESEKATMEAIRKIHIDASLYLGKNQHHSTHLSYILKDFMPNASTQAILQYYEEFKWLLNYLKSSLDQSDLLTSKKEFNIDYKAKRWLYLNHLSNKLRVDDTLCIAFLLKLEFEQSLQSLLRSHSLYKKAYFPFKLGGSNYRVLELRWKEGEITVENVNKHIKLLEVTAKQHVDHIYSELKEMIDLRNDLFEANFFHKLDPPTNLGVMKDDLIPRALIDKTYVEGQIFKHLAKDVKDIYEQMERNKIRG
jgi:hypothetical protein